MLATDDTYVVDNVSDIVVENASEGTDTVRSSITYVLGVNVENLTLTGAMAINGTGNTLNNVLIGNSAANTLSGGTGADQMTGGAGNDTYVVENIGDVVTENANEGMDVVQSAITYTLGVNVENLTLMGATAINGTGNTLDNVLIGNGAINALTGGAGNDTLDGGAGADKLTGGAGNDTYLVDNTGDVVTELASEGTDTVLSSVTYALAANVENITLAGTTAINGTGNSLDNVLRGNSAANTLGGGAGNDTYLFGRGSGQDQISSYDAQSTDDKVIFGAAIAADQIWFSKNNNDLRVDVLGTSDQVTLQNWYLDTAYRVDKFQTSDGSVLLDSQVENLVNAMAAFAPPPPGQLNLSPEMQSALVPVITTSWQSSAA